MKKHFDNKSFTHFIAFHNGIVFGFGVDYDECFKEASEWTDMPESLEYLPATEAAFEYAKANGGDADYGKFKVAYDRVSLAVTYRLFWVSEDQQGSMQGGDFESHEAATAFSKEWLAELLEQGNCEAFTQEDVLAGSFVVERLED